MYYCEQIKTYFFVSLKITLRVMSKKHLSEGPSVSHRDRITSLPQLISFPTDGHVTSIPVVFTINYADAIIPRLFCAPLCSVRISPRHMARSGTTGPNAAASSTQLIPDERSPFSSPQCTHSYPTPHTLTGLKIFPALGR